MVRQLREQGRAAGFRRAPRRQDRGQSRARPAARPARPPAPTGKARDDRQSKGKIMVRLATRYEIPVAFSVARASRAETEELDGDKLETPPLRCKDFSADRGQRAGEVVGPLRPVARASREEKNAATRTNRSSTTTSTGEARRWSRNRRRTARASKPTAAHAAPSSAAARRRPSTAPGARNAAGRARLASMAVRVDKHDRRLFTPTPWGSPSWKRGPSFRRGSAAGSATLAEKRYVRGMRRLRLGLVTVVMIAPGCLRAERASGRWSPRSGCAADSGGRPTASLQLAACGHGPARPGFAVQRRSDWIFFFRSIIERLHGPCGPADGRLERTAGCRPDGGPTKNGAAQTP